MFRFAYKLPSQNVTSGSKIETSEKSPSKLQLFIDGAKILTFEGRYVSKHKAFFYQVLTPQLAPMLLPMDLIL